MAPAAGGASLGSPDPLVPLTQCSQARLFQVLLGLYLPPLYATRSVIYLLLFK